MNVKFFGVIASIVLFVVLTAFSYNVKDAPVLTGSNSPVLPEEAFDYSVDVPKYYNSDQELSNFSNDLNNDIVTLGRVLFYDNNLSKEGSFSCASCHKQEFSFSDNVSLSAGENGVLSTVNVPALNGLLLTPTDHFFWDMRSDNLNEVVLRPISEVDEFGSSIAEVVDKLNGLEYYKGLFSKAYGSKTISESKISEALTQFVSSIVAFNSKYDKSLVENPTEDLTPEERLGEKLFVAACGDCHAGSKGANCLSNGLDPEHLADSGKGKWSNVPDDMGVFRNPSLRNIELTGPYMHDGRFTTLEEVIDFYSEGLNDHPNSSYTRKFGLGFKGLDFAQNEKSAIKAFMLTFTDRSITTDVKWSNPFGVAKKRTTDINTINSSIVNKAGILSIQFDNTNNHNAIVNVYSLSGDLIDSKSSINTRVDFEVMNWTSGIYIVAIKKGELHSTQKIVVVNK